ncbi:glutathione S-transferase family protein [Kordiimonas pumila]|uniref:Glutathione S-transferase family protein n=1 Tax=Kordiimonas pumila TaxID=2161677 RepID=A0ABV7D762_9PROT|nr:glutathione S-transferase family protein [Kordiimonas pumila]
MTDSITLYGHPVSPYVRKVLIAFAFKGMKPDVIIPVSPFIADDGFKKISPLKRIPVLQIGDFILPDSTAICEYIDEAYSGEKCYPGDVTLRAKARWFEEYADDHIARNAVFGLFFEKIIKPALLKQETNMDTVNTTLTEKLPDIMSYLELQLQNADYLLGEKPFMADFAVASFFVNAGFAGWLPDAALWPKTTAYLKRISANPHYASVTEFGTKALKCRRAELEELIQAYISPDK